MKQREFCVELTYAPISSPYINYIKFDTAKVRQKIGSEGIYKIENESDKLLEITTKFLTKSKLIALYNRIEDPLLTLSMINSHVFPYEDGGCHINIKMDPSKIRNIQNFLARYPTISWYWQTPAYIGDKINYGGCKDSAVSGRNRINGIVLRNGTWIHNIESLKEVELRFFGMPRDVYVFESQLDFADKLVKHCSNNNYSEYKFCFFKKYDTFNGLKRNFEKACEIIGYDNPKDYTYLKKRSSYGRSFLI